MTTEENSWVFDSLVGFLQGPIWNSPIMTFIEQKCAIFDSTTTTNEEEYKKIHDEYKDLVDVMLGSYMEDIGITPEQFETACGQNPGHGIQINFHKSLFEQVWAANDYEIFKRMMIQKNMELQLQALEMIQQRCGINPQSFVPDDAHFPSDEAQIMEEVLKKSIEEFEMESKLRDGSTLELEKSLSAPEEHQRLEAEFKREKELLDSALKLTIREPETTDKTEEITREEKSFQNQAEVDAEELERRQQYLKKQRDKLLALKKSERQKKLKAAEVESVARPKSARVAQAALSGQQEPPSQALQVRRALADRLRSEVVGRI